MSRLSLSVLAILGTVWLLACEGAGGGSGDGAGGAGGTPQATCENVAGTFVLVGSDFADEGPWVWIHESSELGCGAVVSSVGHDGRRYQIAVTDTAAVLTPVSAPAIGGSKTPTEHRLTEWNQIRLDLVGGKLAGTATADVVIDWNQEDIWGTYPNTLELALAEAPPATLGVSGAMLPWRTTRLLASRPSPDISAQLALPSSQWSATDLVEPDAEGIIAATLAFSGAWDAIRGQTLAVSVLPGMVDLSGAPVATSELAISVHEIGPPLPAHPMFDTSGVASWGAVEPYGEGACATLGCLRIGGYPQMHGCGVLAGIGGQLLTEGKTEAVLSMRLESDETYVNVPMLWNVEVVTEAGTKLAPKAGGAWDSEKAEQVWTYDVTGQARVGFAIESALYCHGWGGAIIVDAVTAQ
jgi:hypothetical protein